MKVGTLAFYVAVGCAGISLGRRKVMLMVAFGLIALILDNLMERLT